jgi:CheY-like chemotaxis protein
MKTVLIVDDEPILTEVLSTALSDAGFETVTAFNGEEGLAQLAKQDVDVVLLDYMMPILDGDGMLQRARADRRWTRLPVILMSGIEPSAIPLGAHTAFLRKPFRLHALLEAIAKVLPS